LSDQDLCEQVRYNNTKIEDIGLTFNLPGYNEIELKRGGTEVLVSARNLEEYVALVFDQLVMSGPLQLVEAFRQGFNRVFSINHLKSFTSLELEQIICGCQNESWDYDVLVENIIPNHGIVKDAPILKWLIKIMSEMSNLEKKKFLLFATGSPRLPLGGKNKI
jgi:E3 ubiquitin-protein ligase TRIP12